MTDALSLAFADVDRSYQKSLAVKAVSPPAVALTGGMPVQTSKLNKAQEQYRHFSGWSYVAIRAVASKIAGQDFFVGKVHQQGKPGRKVELPNFAKSLGTRVEPLENHKILSAIDAPNPLMVRWSLVFSSVASLLLTGRAHWWLTETSNGLQIWPIPSHWIEPADPLRGTWKLSPPGNAEPLEVAGESVISIVLPSPCDLFSCVSPLQSQALAVSVDESIQRSQHDSFSRGIFPQLAFRVGTPSADPTVGNVSKPVLTDEQRTELVDAIRRLYAGESNRHNR